MSATPLLDRWLARLIGQGSVPLPEALRDWQLKKLRDPWEYEVTVSQLFTLPLRK